MTTDPIGLYVHIPFCVRKCNYCDFCSVPDNTDLRERYVDALITEIESHKTSPRIKIDTVFFGGGTPSLLSAEQFGSIVKAIKRSFYLCDDYEFTVEVNPGTANGTIFRAFKEHGVNRISIGFQSMHDNEQKILGRIHNYDDFYDTMELARSLGFDNINVDVMYGIPEQTPASFKNSLLAVTDLSPEHISCYGLIVEDGTPFGDRRDELDLPDEDLEVEMYQLACELLRKKGYEHYEISNYARRGKQCRHNLKYWRDEDYIGVGLAAHSYYKGERLYNTDSFDEYLPCDRAKYQYAERRPGKDAFEYIMLALRLSEGLSLIKYEGIFGESFLKGRERILARYAELGLIDISKATVRLTEKGFYLSNTIISDLV